MALTIEELAAPILNLLNVEDFADEAARQRFGYDAARAVARLALAEAERVCRERCQRWQRDGGMAQQFRAQVSEAFDCAEAIGNLKKGVCGADD